MPNRRDRRKALQASAKKIQAVKFSAPVDWVEAAADAGESLKRFTMTAYTGGAMSLAGFYHPVVVDLAGFRATNERPILFAHDPERIVGHSDSVEVSPKRIKVSGVISGVGNDATNVVAASKNGFPWQASIGAVVTRMEKIDAGTSVTVNGHKLTGPLLVAREARLQEVSFVPLGADDNTTATVAANAPLGDDEMKFDQWLAANQFGDATEEQKKILQSAFDAEQRADEKLSPTADESLVTAMRSTAAAEMKRIAAIQKLTEGHPDIAAQAVEENWNETKVELEVIRASRPKNVAIHAGNDQTNYQVISAAVMQATRATGHERMYDDKTLQAAHTRFRGRIGLQQLLMEAAWDGGYDGRHFDKSDAGMRSILRAAFSTFDLPGILSNTANKFLMDGFNAVDQAWSAITAKRSVSDFKTVSTYRMTGGFDFEEVGPDGELKHGTVGETEYANRVRTYGRMFAITRTDIVNDSLGALSALPTRIGRGAALNLNTVFWTEFLNNSAFFTTGNGNFFDGAATALQASSLQTAEQKFLDQVDEDGKPVGIKPEILLVPTSLKRTAMELMQSSNFNTGGAASTAQVPSASTWQGAFQVVATPYLNNNTITGYSTTAWYLLANPADFAVIETVFLNGVESPTVETAEADFNQLGIQMRGVFDYGVAKQEYRGGVKSKGAA